MAALSQINRGTQQQAAATQQTSAALTEIEKSARLAQQRANQAKDRVKKMGAGLTSSAQAVEKLIVGVSAGAATSLARLMRDQGRQAEAIVCLRPIYDRFTEGFDTADLITAKHLLNELGT